MKIALFLVLLALTITSVVAGAVMQTFVMFGDEQAWPWWLPAALIVLGVVGIVAVCILGVNVMRREYELMTPDERESIHRVGRAVGKEVLDGVEHDREPDAATVLKVAAKAIKDELK